MATHSSIFAWRIPWVNREIEIVSWEVPTRRFAVEQAHWSGEKKSLCIHIECTQLKASLYSIVVFPTNIFTCIIQIL